MHTKLKELELLLSRALGTRVYLQFALATTATRIDATRNRKWCLITLPLYQFRTLSKHELLFMVCNRLANIS